MHLVRELRLISLESERPTTSALVGSGDEEGIDMAFEVRIEVLEHVPHPIELLDLGGLQRFLDESADLLGQAVDRTQVGGQLVGERITTLRAAGPSTGLGVPHAAVVDRGPCTPPRRHGRKLKTSCQARGAREK